MAKEDKENKPIDDNTKTPAANVAEKTKAVKEAQIATSQAIKPLQVEVHFSSIDDLKQAVAFDNDGNLILTIQFKTLVNQFETFRLLNLLKQPHGILYAVIGSPQSAMDFRFSTEGKIEILKAELAQGKDKAPAPANTKNEPKITNIKELAVTNNGVTFQVVNFNHIETDSNPFGVYIEYLIAKTGEIKSAAGRGKSAIEAVITGIKQTDGFNTGINQPFEILMELKKTEETPAQIKLVRTIELGKFFEGGEEEPLRPK
jgi:hypothetical protein